MIINQLHFYMRQYKKPKDSKKDPDPDFIKDRSIKNNKKLIRRSASFYEDYRKKLYPQRDDHLNFMAKNISY